MAARGWGGSVATAIGVAAGAGAAQLGFGYGLGIIAWLPSTDGTSEAAWVASLSWAVWIAATSTVAGAICAHRLSAAGRTAASTEAPPPTPATFLWRAALAVSSAIGGLVTVVLVAVPARSAVRADTFSPQTTAAGYAVVGVMIGLLAAIWAISSPAVAKNVLGTVCWLWALAVIAVIHGVLSGRGLASAQLGVWQVTADGGRFWFRDYFYWPGAALSLGSALVIGALAARVAARRPMGLVGAAVSGISGPLLVAVAYFVAAPRLVGVRTEQVSAHLMAPYAVIAGLAGSALVAALAQRSEALARHAEALAQDAEERPPWPEPARTDAGPDARLGQPGRDRDPAGDGPDARLIGPGPDPRPVEGAALSTGPAADRADDAAGRRGRSPAQRASGSSRTADKADDLQVRPSGGPAHPRDPESDDERVPGVAEPAEPTAGADLSSTDEPVEPVADEEKPKGRLSRLGRRNR